MEESVIASQPKQSQENMGYDRKESILDLRKYSKIYEVSQPDEIVKANTIDLSPVRRTSKDVSTMSLSSPTTKPKLAHKPGMATISEF